MDIIPRSVGDYVLKMEGEIPQLFKSLEEETKKKASMPQMICGSTVGKFLKLLIQINDPIRVIELGTFTGYSTLWMASGLSARGQIITCDSNEETSLIAKKYFDLSPWKTQIKQLIGPALNTLASIRPSIDFAFIDADKINYLPYYQIILEKLSPGGLIVVDNCLWSGKVLNPQDQESIHINQFNQFVSCDERVENVFLTVRDGLQVIRKK